MIRHMRANCRNGFTSRLVFPRWPQSSGRAPSTITTELRFQTGFPESAPPRAERT
jgi:hypothetical protein